MEDANANVVQKIQQLNDLELAALTCLVADQHCLIATDDDIVDTLDQELRIVRSVDTLSRFFAYTVPRHSPRHSTFRVQS